MVAQFLRLKLRLLGNIFRRSPWQVVGIVLGLVYGVGLATILFLTLVGLRFVLVRRNKSQAEVAEAEPVEVAPPVTRPHPVSKKKKRRKRR